MISRLHGTFVEKTSIGALVIDCNGVGYEVLPTRRLVEKVELGAKCTVVVFTDVREDSIRLFGFADHAEREVFNLLIRVSGVGTKTARELVSALDTRAILRAIGQSDISGLQAVKGIGKKTAERIVLELRDKVAELIGADISSDTGQAISADQLTRDAAEALVTLGFTRGDADRAVKQAAAAGKFSDSGKLVAEALQYV